MFLNFMAIYRADGTEYKKVVTKDENTTAHMTAKGGYTGLDSATGDYLRTPIGGLIPNVSGGSGYIGTSGWPFSAGYFNQFYVGGYANGNYHLSTASFICNSWIRSNGATGWYNETYGGGICMQDSTYVRVYNNKEFRCENNISTPKAMYANDVYYIGNSNYRALWATDGITNMQWGNSTHTYFHYNTSAGAFGVNCWLSDKSLKERIQDTRITEALNKISQFKHVEFDWKNADEHTYLGYVADDVEKILPCLIHKVEQYDKDNKPNGQFLKQIDHTTLIPLITMGIQELIYENELLWTFNNQVVDEFEKRDKLISDLSVRLEKLENGN